LIVALFEHFLRDADVKKEFALCERSIVVAYPSFCRQIYYLIFVIIFAAVPLAHINKW